MNENTAIENIMAICDWLPYIAPPLKFIYEEYPMGPELPYHFFNSKYNSSNKSRKKIIVTEIKLMFWTPLLKKCIEYLRIINYVNLLNFMRQSNRWPIYFFKTHLK